ncbi:MAG: shikimate kinase [Melioribacteraceae bacterium]|nr:shikimate kinase [Melioribacteraceae bacterium]
MLDRIYLTGFMTSGKSTLGKILANVLGWDFFDLDKEIENQEGMKITDIFENKGEGYFRKIETDKLKELSDKKNVLISLGGGTIVNNQNAEFITSHGKLIYLKVEPEIIYTRIKKKTDRPLFKEFVLAENSKEAFIDKISSMMAERDKYYKKADLIFHVDNSPIGTTVDKLAKILNRIIHEENKN